MGVKFKACMCVNLVVIVSLTSTYFTFIRHPPPEEILKNQQNSHSRNARTFDLDPHKVYSIAEISEAAWTKWVYENNYVSIGDVFDGSCGECSNMIYDTCMSFCSNMTYDTCMSVNSNMTYDTCVSVSSNMTYDSCMSFCSNMTYDTHISFCSNMAYDTCMSVSSA